MDLSSLNLSAAEFQKTLETLYDQQMPLVAQFVNLGRAIGGIACLLYISGKVYGHQARAEPIDLFPLLRPFAIGLCILLFPQLCGAMRGLTLAVSHTTDTMQRDQQGKINALYADKQAALEHSATYKDFATDKAKDDKLATMNPLDLSGRMGLEFKRLQFEVGQNFREWMKNILELGAIGARLFVSLLMTLFLSVLSIAGPLAFGISIFPGFSGGIQKWFGYFISISLWLPIANIFSMFLGQMQIMLLTNDVARLRANGSLETADFGYMLFLVLSIGTYLFIPKAADMLIAASGASSAASSFIAGASGAAALSGAAGGGGMRGAATVLGAGVGAAQGAAGMAGAGQMTQGERFGHRAGSAIRNYMNRSKNA
jgi:conjugative transposon TraJ protein